MVTYIRLLMVPVMWSIVGALVKTASISFGHYAITFSRFFCGAVFLALLIRIRGGKVRVEWRQPWIWYGVAGKSLNYLTENLAISLGYSYGNVIIMPLMTIFLSLASILVFREGFSIKKGIAVILCIGGVLMLTWKGSSSTAAYTPLTAILFTVSAVGAALHILSQKILIARMDSADMNLSVFWVSALVCAVPLPASPILTGLPQLAPILSLLALGFITGISFQIYADCLKAVPLVVATLLTNSSSLLTLCWSKLLFNEPMSPLTGLGTIIFIAGVIVVNLPDRQPQRQAVA